MKPLRILVTGSRNWTDREAVRAALLEVLAEITTIGTPVLVHGNARGADRIAEDVWMELANHVPGGLAVERFEADWRQHGRAAGPTRNAAMVATRPTVCLAFPLGESRGTRGCMALAEKSGIPVVVTEGQT